MSLIQTNGIILRVSNFGEFDRYLTVLTPQLGAIEVLAKRVRRAKGGQARSTEVFSLCQFILFQKNDKFKLNQVQLVEGFSGLRTDVVELTCAAHLADIWLTAVRYEESPQSLYELAAYTLYALGTSDMNPLAIVRACEVRVLTQAGFGFYLERCGFCERDVSADPVIDFALAACQPVCERTSCRRALADLRFRYSKDGAAIIALDRQTRAAISYFAEAPLPRLYHFKISERMLTTLADLIPVYLSEHFERYFHKLDFLNKL
ncbi:MAG TPA: DNA repair protein RecO [Clostridiaceae bacterium]|nr:DNA repair protein RecO [Clostridiaceae bacterium]